MLNGSAAGIIGVYLMLVLFNDKEDELLKMMTEETGFLRWAGALLALFFVFKMAGGKVGNIIQQLTMLALIALMLNKGEIIFKQIDETFTKKEEN